MGRIPETVGQRKGFVVFPGPLFAHCLDGVVGLPGEHIEQRGAQPGEASVHRLPRSTGLADTSPPVDDTPQAG